MKSSRLQPFGRLIEAHAGARIGDLRFETIDTAVLESAFALVRGVEPPSRAEFLAWCAAAPGMETVEWDFGPVMELREDPSSPNYLFSRESVPFHWDGAFHREPDVLAFHCLEAPEEASGGETLIVDTRRVWRSAAAGTRAAWSRLSFRFETEKLAHYGGRVERALVQTHPRTGETILRFAEAAPTERNPVRREIVGAVAAEGERLAAELAGLFYDPRNCVAHRWRRGDLLFVDNHSTAHGRAAYREGQPRHLRRIQLARRDAPDGINKI